MTAMITSQELFLVMLDSVDITAVQMDKVRTRYRKRQRLGVAST